MRITILTSFLLALPFFVICQDDVAPQKSGSFYLETSNFTGAISSLTMGPSIGFSVTDDIVLGVGFSTVSYTHLTLPTTVFV